MRDSSPFFFICVGSQQTTSWVSTPSSCCGRRNSCAGWELSKFSFNIHFFVFCPSLTQSSLQLVILGDFWWRGNADLYFDPSRNRVSRTFFGVAFLLSFSFIPCLPFSSRLVCNFVSGYRCYILSYLYTRLCVPLDLECSGGFDVAWWLVERDSQTERNWLASTRKLWQGARGMEFEANRNLGSMDTWTLWVEHNERTSTKGAATMLGLSNTSAVITNDNRPEKDFRNFKIASFKIPVHLRSSFVAFPLRSSVQSSLTGPILSDIPPF